MSSVANFVSGTTFINAVTSWLHCYVIVVYSYFVVFLFLIFILFLELCRFSGNCFLSFINDNIWPWPFYEKVPTSAVDSKIKQNFCTPCRRVTANSFYYFGLLIVASILNVLFKYDIFGILHNSDVTNSILNNGSEIQGVQDQTFIIMLGANFKILALIFSIIS